MKPVRVGVVCDLLEEGWHSMDLMADMLLETLPVVAGASLTATRLRPPMVRRWSRLPLIGDTPRAQLADRLTNRLWDYPRWLGRRAAEFDVFHIVDHSYAHLVHVLPADRTIVTCHDLDAIRAALPAGSEPGSAGPARTARMLATRVLKGLERARHIACVTHATKDELLATGRFKPDRLSVVYEGVHPSCVPDGRGPDGLDILHVGSTIPRKRIDVLLEILAALRRTFRYVRLIRVGGLTPTQRALAQRLDIVDAIIEMPFLERCELATVYRRAAILVLPSDREGFGLPVVEAMACGTPVVASAIPALVEVGGSGAVYCRPGDVRQWVDTLTQLLRQRETDPAAWETRRRAAMTSASRFDWHTHARGMAALYLQ